MDGFRKVLGERIREARERLSFSQRRLAKEAGLASHQIIHQIEKGEREVKAWELVRLARALRLEITQLLSPTPPEARAQVLWRKLPQRDKELIEADFLQRCERYALVEKLCGIEPGDCLPREKVDIVAVGFRDAEELGERLREVFGLGSRPAAALVDVLEEKYGVKIWYRNLGEEGSAASTRGSFGYAILMNSEEAPWRRNFNFAHEVFHLVTWDSVPVSSLANNQTLWGKAEKLANAFASALLLPADEVRRAFKGRLKDGKVRYNDLIQLAREFNVSTEALLRRLENMGIIDSDTVDGLLNNDEFRELDRIARRAEWWQPPTIPERFVRLAFEAYQCGRLSRARLAEFLDTSLVDLTDTLLKYGLDDRKDYQTTVRASGR